MLQLRIRCKYPLDQLQGPELRNLKKHLMDSFKAYGLIQIASWRPCKLASMQVGGTLRQRSRRPSAHGIAPQRCIGTEDPAPLRCSQAPLRRGKKRPAPQRCSQALLRRDPVPNVQRPCAPPMAPLRQFTSLFLLYANLLSIKSRMSNFPSLFCVIIRP